MFTHEIDSLMRTINHANKRHIEEALLILIDTVDYLQQNEKCAPLNCENCENKISCRLLSQIHFIMLSHYNNHSIMIEQLEGYDNLMVFYKDLLSETCYSINERYYKSLCDMIEHDIYHVSFKCLGYKCRRCNCYLWCKIITHIGYILAYYKEYKR